MKRTQGIRWLALAVVLFGLAGCGERSRVPEVRDGTERGIDLVAATVDLKARLQSAPGDVEAQFALANVYARRGLYAEAIPHYRQVVEAAPERAAAWRNLALCYERQGLMTDAQAAADKAMLLEPSNQLFQQDAARLALRVAGQESGERAFTMKVSEAYSALRRHDANGLLMAAALVDDLMRSWPEQAETWNVAGIVAQRQGELEEAIRRFDLAIARDPRTLQARYNRALLAWHQEDRTEAQRQLEALRQLLPKDTRTRFYLKQLLDDLAAGKSPHEARIAAREFGG